MKRRVVAVLSVLICTAALVCGCGAQKSVADTNEAKLDPDNPVSLTVWHYYNGTQQTTFDELLEEFNDTVGKDKGIHMEGYSYGSVSDLEAAVTSSLNGEVGSEKLPDIFSSYADTAYFAQKQGKLVNLSEYFSQEELSEYVDPYIQEGRFQDSDATYLLPIAKSTEVLMLNKTDWDTFAKATGASLDDLKTTEGITATAQKYYEWTDAQTPDIPDDGKAFYGRDSMSNYFVIGMKQMGKDIFDVKDGQVVVNTDKELIHRLWENYYVPYVSGYFASYGKFRSDDVKTGKILAYTGSTASAFYFPDQVEDGDNTYKISYVIQDPPVMQGGENYRVQQGAGMAVTKSDTEHEYASSVFLKWFTGKDQNLKFVCQSSYLPVLKEANHMDAIDQIVKEEKISLDDKTYQCLNSVLNSFDQTRFYTMKITEHSYQMRKVLDYNLADRAEADRKAVDKAVKAGASRKSELKKYTSEKSFDSWYKEFCDALKKAQEE